MLYNTNLVQVSIELLVGCFCIGVGYKGGDRGHSDSWYCVVKTKNSNQLCLDFNMFTAEIETSISIGLMRFRRNPRIRI